MPVYDFKCQKCGFADEVIVLPPAENPSECPECGGEFKKLFSGRIGTQFVGWGFSSTDSLMPQGKKPGDFKTIRDKASELFD